MPALTALVGATVFDGTRLHHDRAVLIDGPTIAGIVGEDETGDADVVKVSGTLAPGFIDIQVNGGGGVLFNDEPTVEGIAAIGAAHRPYGTTGFLPTLITDTPDAMAAAIGAAREAHDQGVPGYLGIHLEGPFLNPERKGVHRADYMRPITEDDLRLIAAPGKGRTLLTIAPEMVPVETIKRLTEAGVIVAAGHTRATYETIREAHDAGLTGFTHLYNAMPPMAGRDPGPVGAALDDPTLWCSLIVDLHHVSAVGLKIALAARGTDRTILVTDAMSSVGSDLNSFDLHGRTILRQDGRLTTEDDTLAGSDLDMATAVRNTVEVLGQPLEKALHMASGAPAAFLGLDDRLGKIEAGFRADLVLLDANLQVTSTWIGGVRD